MIRLLQFLIFGHVHKWATEAKGRWERPEDGAAGPRYVCRCEGCGAYKAFDL